MKRKIVKQGGSALTITLPFQWAKKYGLDAGDEVEVDESGNKLIISSKGEVALKTKDIDITGLDPMIKRVLGALYKAGYDGFTVKFDKIEELETAQEVIREEFIGFEVTTHGKKYLEVKEVSHVESEEFNTMLRRIFMIIKTEGDDGIEAIEKNDDNLLKMIASRDKDVNKIADFCRRVINKYPEERNAPLYFIVEQLEKIGDNYRDLCVYASQNKIKFNPELKKMFLEINNFFFECHNLFFNFDIKDIAEFGKKRYELRDKINKMMNSAQKNELRVLFFLYTILESTFDMNGAIMAVRL